MDVLYIFPWKIKPTNSMQSIACIMVIYARRSTFRVRPCRRKVTIRCILYWFGWLQYAHIFASNICMSKERVSLNFWFVWLRTILRCFLVILLCLIQDAAFCYTFVFCLVRNYTIHINNSNGLLRFSFGKQRPFPFCCCGLISRFT